VRIHDTTRTRDNSSLGGEDPTLPPSSGLRPDRTPEPHQAHTGLAGPRRSRKAPAALLQHAGLAAVPTKRSRRRDLQEAPRTQRPHPAQAHLRPTQAHLEPGLPRSWTATAGGHRRPGALPRNATAPPPPNRAGPLPHEEHCFQGEGRPRPTLHGTGNGRPPPSASPGLCPATSTGGGDGGRGWREGQRSGTKKETPSPLRRGGGERARTVLNCFCACVTISAHEHRRSCASFGSL
jgi:hypothetical protein